MGKLMHSVAYVQKGYMVSDLIDIWNYLGLIFDCSVVGGADCPEGTEWFGAGGIGHSLTGTTGAEYVENFEGGVVVHLGVAFLVGFVNFNPSPPLCVLPHFWKWSSVVPMCSSLQLVWG